MFEGFTLRRLNEADKPNSFKTGDAKYTPLKTFVRKDARKYEDEGLARTYVFHDDVNECLAAYVTIVCSEVISEEAPLMQAEQLHYPYKQWPAIKISRLLVDSRYRREGARWKEGVRLGEALVHFTLGVAVEQICPAAGCRFVVLDAKADAINFYKKLGFRVLDTTANRKRDAPVMFLDLHRSKQDEVAAGLEDSANDAAEEKQPNSAA